MNLDYAKVFAAYNRQPRLNGLLGEFEARAYIVSHFQPKFQKELESYYFAKYPRRKIFRPDALTEDEVELIRNKWQNIALRVFEHKYRQRCLLDNLLNYLAAGAYMIPMPEMRVIRTSSAHSYSSQGYGCCKYARNSLEPNMFLLIKSGFKAEIKEKPGSKYTEKTWGVTYCDYELWSNAAEWQLDALKRQGRMSLEEWALCCWNNGINPKVINPFLDQEIFDRTMEAHMRGERAA